MSCAVFLEWQGIRVHCGHDRAGRGRTLGRARRTGCARSRRVFESAGEQRKRERWFAEFPIHGANGRDGVSRSGEAPGGGSPWQYRSESERTVREQSTVPGISRDRYAKCTPVGAWDDRGHDVLPLLAKRDRKYVTDFEGLPFAGFAKLHWIELDLGSWDASKPLRLLLDGYTDYFTATSMYSADQAGIKVIAPYVEIQNAQGNWVRVVDDMGFPAGLARTMVTDLTGKIPPGTRRIRIVSNLKIYWDCVRIDQTPEQKDVRVSEVPLATAELAYLGYPKEIRLHPATDTVYSYSQRSLSGPYAHAAGNYTRYGDVKTLLSRSDDEFTVFSSGEGVKLEFDPSGMPTLPAGWVRDYFFYADGFEKDLDFYAANAFTVEPLPHHGLTSYPYPAGKEYPADGDHLGYEFEYNTRQRSDRLPGNLRYDYPPPK